MDEQNGQLYIDGNIGRLFFVCVVGGVRLFVERFFGCSRCIECVLDCINCVKSCGSNTFRTNYFVLRVFHGETDIDKNESTKLITTNTYGKNTTETKNNKVGLYTRRIARSRIDILCFYASHYASDEFRAKFEFPVSGQVAAVLSTNADYRSNVIFSQLLAIRNNYKWFVARTGKSRLSGATKMAPRIWVCTRSIRLDRLTWTNSKSSPSLTPGILVLPWLIVGYSDMCVPKKHISSAFHLVRTYHAPRMRAEHIRDNRGKIRKI